MVFLRSYASGHLEQEQVLRVAETDLRKQQRKKSEKRAEIKKGARSGRGAGGRTPAPVWSNYVGASRQRGVQR